MKRPRGSPTSRLLDRAERERDAARAEVGRLRARAEAAERRALPHSLPEDCPLFYDGCHCLEALEADRPSHAVRADAAEAEVERLTKAVGAAERALEVYRTESVEHWQTRARESRERTTLQLDEARAEVARLRANLEHDGFDCPGCTHGSEHDISDRSCIYGPNSRCATETRAEAAEARAEEADRIRVKAQDRMETAEAEVERLRGALRECLRDYEAAHRRLAEKDEIPHGLNYKNRERWAALAEGREPSGKGKDR